MLIFLFTDIEGSSKLWEEHTGVMTGVIARHDKILRELIGGHGGRITKHTGDGITAVFQTAGQPLTCAVEVQVRFAAEPWGEIGALPIRAGLHAGEAEFHRSAGTADGDYFGPPVNATARVMSAAWGGQILLTPEVTQVSALPEEASLLDLGQHLLKNVSAPQQLYQLLHPELSRHEFPPPRTLSGQSIRQAVGERGGQIAGLEPGAMGIALLSATLGPALQGKLDPESGALEGNLGVLEDLGAFSLRGFVAAFAGRLRAAKPLPAREIQSLLHDQLLVEWQGGGEAALALRSDASRLLQAVHGVESAMTAASKEVKEALARGLADLGSQFGEFRWMLAGVQETLAEMRTRQALQLALQREQLDLQRQQLVKTNLILQRQHERPVLAEAPPEVALAGGEVEEEPPAQVPCPYMGLAAFEAEDAEYFFGREKLVAELTARLAGTRFLAVVGPSGSGKSSLVRAGLLPAVWAGALPGSEDWQMLVLTPGAHPLEELAVRIALLNGYTAGALLRELEKDDRGLHLAVKQALADAVASGKQPETVKLLLVVDQFEEIFALCHDEAERQRFIEALLYAVEAEEGSIIVLLTIRADFYGRCADYHQLAARMSDGLLVGPMGEEELRAAIEQPAAVAGLRLEPGLADTILDDVAGEPGALPLLSHALLETFERRRGAELTLSGYAASGGVAGAIAQTADTVCAGLSGEEQAIARSIFLRLTELGEEGAQDTRRRVAPEELVRTPEESQAVEAVLKTLADARLVTTGEGSIEVAHEALIREWPVLRGWLEEDREGLRIHRHLTEAAQEWERLGREPGELYRGARLAAAGEWAEAHAAALNPLEREFLAAAQELAQRREAEREARRQRELEAAQKLAAEQKKRADVEQRRAEEQAKSAGRLRRRALLLAGAMAIAVILAVVAVLAFQQATRSADSAQAEALSRATAEAIAVREGATAEAASILAIGERAAAETAQAEEAAQRAEAQAEAEARATAEMVAVGQQAVAEERAREALEAYSLSLAANAQEALNDKDPATALVLALAATGIENPPEASREILQEAAFSPGPRRQFIPEDSATLGDSGGLAISPDGRTALAGYDVGTLILWDLVSGEEILRFGEGDRDGHNAYVWAVAFSPDGTKALSGAIDSTVILWDVTTGEEIRRFVGHSGEVRSVAVSPDGRMALSGGAGSALVNGSETLILADDLDYPGELILWDVETGLEIQRFHGQSKIITQVAFTPDGRNILASTDASLSEERDLLYLWDVETGELIRGFTGVPRAFDMGLSPDGNMALIGDRVSTMSLWDLNTGEQLQTFKVDAWGVFAVAFTPDGRLGLSGDAEGSVIVWDLETGERVVDLKAHTGAVNKVVVSPDGRTALSSSWDGSLILHDLVAAGEIRRLKEHTGEVLGLAFTPDGKYLLSGGSGDEDLPLRLWDLGTGEQIRVLAGHTGDPLRITISPDGRTALSTSQDLTARLWDLESGEEIRRYDVFDIGHSTLAFGIDFTPDGGSALTGSLDGTVILWDLESGLATRHFTGHTGWVWDVAVGPDGKRAVSCGDDGLIVWNLETGEQLRRLLGIEGGALSVAISPDGKTAFSGNGLWDLDTGLLIRRFEGYHHIPWNVAFTPDGKYAISTGDSGLLYWDLETGERLRYFRGHEEPQVRVLAVSPDGKTAVSGGSDTNIIQWQLAAPTQGGLFEWIDTNRYVRELTCEERELYQIDEELCEEQTAEATPIPTPRSEETTPRPQRPAQIGENRGEIAQGDFDIWLYEGQAGETLTIRLIADNPADNTPFDVGTWLELGILDTVLFVIGPDDRRLAENADAESEESTTNSLIEGLVLPVDGIYRIEVRSYGGYSAGVYTLVIEPGGSPGE